MKQYLREKKGNILTIIIGASVCIILYFALANISKISLWLNGILGIISPFIIGFAFAFFLNPLMEIYEHRVLSNVKIKQRSKHVLSAILALISGILIVTLLLYIIVPQFMSSLAELSKTYESYLNNFCYYAN